MQHKKIIYDRAYVMCLNCGKTFNARDASLQALKEHQKDNKGCRGYMYVQMKGGNKK